MVPAPIRLLSAENESVARAPRPLRRLLAIQATPAAPIVPAVEFHFSPSFLFLRFASHARGVSYITATRHFNGDPGVCFIGTAPGSSLTLPFGRPNRCRAACFIDQLAPTVARQNQRHSSKCDETKRSLDCVWQALGVEHVSLHSSLASHSAGSYNFSSKDH